jgi:hypothetical protein
MKSGLLTLRAHGRTIDFYVGDKTIVNGTLIRCAMPPAGAFIPPHEFCPDWPRHLTIGKTWVFVTYWTASRYGKSVYVTDEFDY